jgi:hypothetical protein
MHKASSRNWSGEFMLINEEVQCGGGHGCGGHVGEWQEGFIKNDMSRNKNAIRLELETPIAFVFREVAEEDT